MTTKTIRSLSAILLSAASLLFLSSCLTSKKMDRYISEQYDNQVPKQDKKKQAGLVINSSLTTDDAISHTVQKTSKVLPLIVYWQYDYRHTCTLNPALA